MQNMKPSIRKTLQLPLISFYPFFKISDRKFGLIKAIIGCLCLDLLFVSSMFAQTKSDLPPKILEMVPPGTVLISQQFTGTPVMAGAEFTSEKNVSIGLTVEYHLKINAFDNSSPTWKMRESAYRKQMEDRIKSKRNSLSPESSDLGVFTADPVTETKKPWGSGLTQRILNHPPQAKEYVTYNCAYFGMEGGIVFELFVSNLPDSPQEGDSWAQKVAELASKLTVSNIGD